MNCTTSCEISPPSFLGSGIDQKPRILYLGLTVVIAADSSVADISVTAELYCLTSDSFSDTNFLSSPWCLSFSILDLNFLENIRLLFFLIEFHSLLVEYNLPLDF